MGCGSSTAQPVAIEPAAADQPQHADVGTRDANQPSEQQAQLPAAPHPPHAAAEQSERTGKGAVASGGGGGVGSAVASQRKEKHLLQRLSSEGAAAAAGSTAPSPRGSSKAPAPPMCVSNVAHGAAAVWCASCEENLCAACDSSAHASDSSHQRTPLTASASGGSDKPKSKFVVREVASTPAQRAAQAQRSNGTGGASPTAAAPGARQFKVGAFRNATEEEAKQNDPASVAVAVASSRRAGAFLPSLQPAAPVSAVASGVSSTRVKQSSGARGGALSALGDEELSRMSHVELDDLWQTYDRDSSGVLERSELRRLAVDVIQRLLQLVRADLQRTNPGLPAEQLDEQVERERLLVLPGRNLKESQREMTRMLQERLDVNGDGKVTKIEYLAQWNEFAGQVFQLKKEGALECSIM